MDKICLNDLVEDHLEKAKEAASGRSATTIYGGRERHLRQTLIAIRAGEELDDHADPGEATLQVLQGRVTIQWDSGHIDLDESDYTPIPSVMHSVRAHQDSALLLTVSVKRPQAQRQEGTEGL